MHEYIQSNGADNYTLPGDFLPPADFLRPAAPGRPHLAGHTSPAAPRRPHLAGRTSPATPGTAVAGEIRAATAGKVGYTCPLGLTVTGQGIKNV